MVRSGVEMGNLSCAEENRAEAERRTVETVRIFPFSEPCLVLSWTGVLWLGTANHSVCS